MLPSVPVYVANLAGVSVLDRNTGVGFRTPLVSLIGGLLLILVGALIFFDRLAWLIF